MNSEETIPQTTTLKVNSFKTEIINIQNKIVNITILATLFFLFAVSVFSLPGFVFIEVSPPVIGYISISVALTLLALFRNSLSFTVKRMGILILWLVLGVGGIATWGLIGMGIAWLMALSIWTAIVFGVRYGIGISLLTCLIIILTGAASVFHYVFFDFDFNAISTAYPAWIFAVVTYGFLTVFVITCLQPFYHYLYHLKNIKHQLEDEVLTNKINKEKFVNSENEKKAILDGMLNTQITYIDLEMNIIWANKIAKETIGEDCVGKKCHKYTRGLDKPCLDCVAIKSVQGGEFTSGEVSRADGETYYVQCNPVKNQDGDIIGIIVAYTNISQMKKAEDELRKTNETLEVLVEERTQELGAANETLENAVINSNILASEAVIRNEQLAKEIKKRERTEKELKNSEKRYRTIIESIEEGYFEMNTDGKITFFNNAFCRISGFSREENESKFGKDFVVPEQIDEVWRKYADVAKTKEHQSDFYYDIIRKNGERLTVEASISLTYDHNNKITGFRGIVRDVNERKKYEEQLVYQAYHDTLTGLQNRKAFYEKIEETIKQAQRNNNETALAFIDIDKFKEVNDTLGHEAGDYLLKEISSRLRNELRSTDYVFRLGGDEFTIIFTQSENIQLDVILNKIIACLSRPYKLKDLEVDYVAASIGVGCFPQDGKTPELLIKNADVAMYKAKEEGNHFVYFQDINKMTAS